MNDEQVSKESAAATELPSDIRSAAVERLLGLLPEPGQRRTNKELREALSEAMRPLFPAWEQQHYWEVRDDLLERGQVALSRGHGGSVYRVQPRADAAVVHSFEGSLRAVKQAVAALEKQGIHLQPVSAAVNELEKHLENINTVERNIGAIRQEILDPVELAINESNRAGKFSVAGFYVGIGGLILSIVAALVLPVSGTNVPPLTAGTDQLPVSGTNAPTLTAGTDQCANLERGVRALLEANLGLKGDYQPASGEVMIKRFDFVNMLKSTNGAIRAKLWSTEEVRKPNGEIARCGDVAVYLNDRRYTAEGLRQTTTITNNSGLAKYPDNSYGHANVTLCVGDVLQIADHRISMKHVSVTNAVAAPIGDNDDQIVIGVQSITASEAPK